MWRHRSIARRLLSLSFVMLFIAGVITSVQLSFNVRKEMLELMDANLVQYANSLYMLEQQVQGYGLVSDPIKLDDDEHDEHDERAERDARRDAQQKKSTSKSAQTKAENAESKLTETNPAAKPKDKLISSAYHEYGMAFQVWDMDQQRIIIRSRNAPEEAMAPLSGGFVDQALGEHRWRTYVYVDRTKRRAIVVAQEQLVSGKIVGEIVTRLTWPIALGFLLLLLVFFWVIRQSLRPLATLNQAISQRSHLNMQPIQLNQAPAEITPIVRSLNNLMRSLEDSLNKERHFTSNAAHELRTPLAVIDTLTQAAMKSQDTSLLPKIKAATDHARRQIEQLLTLARLDANVGLDKMQPVNLFSVCQTVCADLLNIGDTAIDVQLLGDESACIQSTEEITYILVKNIVENAFKHAAKNGSGQVRIEVQALPTPSVCVTDNGQGIPPEQLARLTERFYRAEQGHDGFGIGLSIVQRIAQLHAATLNIAARDDGVSGLSVSVRYPKQS